MAKYLQAKLPLNKLKDTHTHMAINKENVSKFNHQLYQATCVNHNQSPPSSLTKKKRARTHTVYSPTPSSGLAIGIGVKGILIGSPAQEEDSNP